MASLLVRLSLLSATTTAATGRSSTIAQPQSISVEPRQLESPPPSVLPDEDHGGMAIFYPAADNVTDDGTTERHAPHGNGGDNNN
jgi:hypothetical protein